MSWYDSGNGEKPSTAASSIVVGKVASDCDLVLQGKVRVRLPSLDQEVWARICAPGAGKGGGLAYVPHDGDEVLVALNGRDPADAFIIGGLWNTPNPIPLSNPLTASKTRVFQTGGDGLSHQVTFDDLQQKITVQTSTGQTVNLTADKIEVVLTGGQTKLTLSTADQSITLKAAGSIKLDAPYVQISGKVQTELQGAMVYINSAAPPIPST
jgi:uncharacterized protein involved in type VI secretion and phage assembly